MAKKRAHGEGSITKRADGRWQGAVTVGHTPEGKQKRETVYGKTQAEVKKKLQEIKQRLATGTYSDTRLSLAEYLERWLKEKERTVKPRSAEFYRYNIQKYIAPRLGRVPLDKLTPLQVQTMMSDIADSAGVSTANKCRTTLNAALTQAVRWQLIHRNAVDAVDKLKETKREMSLWTPQQAAHFLDVAAFHRLYALFYLAMSTGMRRGELLGLRWQDVSPTAVTIRQTLVSVRGQITVSTPKTAKGNRRVATSPDVFDVLEAHRVRQESERFTAGEAWVNSGLVFTTEIGTAIHPDTFKRYWSKVQKDAGVPKIRMHDLRHLHVSLLICEGIDPRTIADRVGHSRTSMTMDVYAHLFEEQRQAAAISLLDMLPTGKASLSN